MLRTVVLGSIGLAAAVPAVGAASPPSEEPKDPICPPPMRPSDLPIYDAPHAEYGEYVQEKANQQKRNYIREALMPPVRAVREQAQGVLEHTDSFKHSVEDHYHQLQDRSQWIVQYLREEENKEMRYGAVAMGGLAGFIFGLRGGFIRRILYSGLGTTGMGLVCFPDSTRDIVSNNGAYAKRYINIAYNFLYGVKPGDPQLEVKFPELSFPKDLSEFVDMAASLAASVKQAVMPPPAKHELESKKE